MRESCADINSFLLLELKKLLQAIDDSYIPHELAGYADWLRADVSSWQDAVTRNIEYLEYNSEELDESILSDSMVAFRWFQHLNQHMAPPVLRSKKDDLFTLRILKCLHDSHPRTTDVPVCVTSGQFETLMPARLPTGQLIPPVYHIPSSLVHGVLYLPLLFHEYGHTIYAVHESEFAPVVTELQEIIERNSKPLSQREDTLGAQLLSHTQAVVQLWFKWIQELFCDAVGVVIGQRSFLDAFSLYFQWNGAKGFQVPANEILSNTHPVPWLRVRFLTERASAMGLEEGAGRVLEEWRGMARHLGITEDYFGTYDDRFHDAISGALEGMLSIVCQSGASQGWPNPIEPVSSILSEAWSEFRSNVAAYETWEGSAMARLKGLLRGPTHQEG